MRHPLGHARFWRGLVWFGRLVLQQKPEPKNLPPSELRQYLVENLLHGAVAFLDGNFVVHYAAEVCVGEGDAAEGDLAEDFARGGIAAFAEEKPGWGFT